MDVADKTANYATKTKRVPQGETAFRMQRFLLHQKNEPTRQVEASLDEAVEEVERLAGIFAGHMAKADVHIAEMKKEIAVDFAKGPPLIELIPENLPQPGQLQKLSYTQYKRAFGGHSVDELHAITKFRSNSQKRLLGGLMNYEHFLGYIVLQHTFVLWKRQIVDKKFSYARFLERTLLSSVQWKRWFNLRALLLRWYMFTQWSRKEEAARQRAMKKLVDRDALHMKQWDKEYRNALKALKDTAIPDPDEGFQKCLQYLLPHAVDVLENAHKRSAVDVRQFANFFIEHLKTVNVRTDFYEDADSKKGRINAQATLLELMSLAKQHVYEQDPSFQDDQAIADVIMAVTRQVDERAHTEITRQDFIDKAARDMVDNVYRRILRGRSINDPADQRQLNPKEIDISRLPWEPGLHKHERHMIEEYIEHYITLVCDERTIFAQLRDALQQDREIAKKRLEEAAKEGLTPEQAEAQFYSVENASISNFLSETRRLFEDSLDKAEKDFRRRLPGAYQNAVEKLPEGGDNMGLLPGTLERDEPRIAAKYRTLINAVREFMKNCFVYDLERLRRDEIHRLKQGGTTDVTGLLRERLLDFMPGRDHHAALTEGFGTLSTKDELVPRAFIFEPLGEFPQDRHILQRARHISMNYFRSSNSTVNSLVRTVTLDIVRYVRGLWELLRQHRLQTVLSEETMKSSMPLRQKNQMLINAIEEIAQLEQFFLARFLTIYDVLGTKVENTAAPTALYIITSASDMLRADLDNIRQTLKSHEGLYIAQRAVVADRVLAYFVQRFEEHDENEGGPQQKEIERRAEKLLPERVELQEVLVRLETHEVAQAIRMLRSLWDEVLEEGVMLTAFDSIQDLERRENFVTDEQEAELKVLITGQERRIQQIEHYIREMRGKVRLAALLNSDKHPGDKGLKNLDPLWVLLQTLDLARKELDEQGFFFPADRSNGALLASSKPLRSFQDLSPERQTALKHRVVNMICALMTTKMRDLPRATPEYDAAEVIQVMFADEMEEGTQAPELPQDVADRGRIELEQAVQGLREVVARGTRDYEKANKYEPHVSGLFYDAFLAQVFNAFTVVAYCLHPVVPPPDKHTVTHYLTREGFEEHWQWSDGLPEHKRHGKITKVTTLGGILANLAHYWTGKPTCSIAVIYERFFECVWELHTNNEALSKVPPVKICVACVNYACDLLHGKVKYVSRTLMKAFLAQIMQLFASDVHTADDPRCKRTANHSPLMRIIAYSFLKNVVAEGGDHKAWFNNLHANVPEYHGVDDLIGVLNIVTQCIAAPDGEKWCERLRSLHNSSTNNPAAIFLGGQFERIERIWSKGLDRYIYFSHSRRLMAARALAADKLERGLDHNHGFKHETFVPTVGYKKIHNWRAKGGGFFDPDLHNLSNGDMFMTEEGLNQGPNKMITALLNTPPLPSAKAAIALIHFFEQTASAWRPPLPAQKYQSPLLIANDIPQEAMETIYALATGCVDMDNLLLAADGNPHAEDGPIDPIPHFNIHEVLSAWFARVFSKVMIRFPEWRREFPRTLDYLQAFAFGILEYNWKQREGLMRESRLKNDEMKFAEMIRARAKARVEQPQNLEELIVNAEDFAQVFILSGSGFMNKSGELEIDNEAGLVAFDAFMQKDLAQVALVFCNDKDYAELFICFVAMAVGRRIFFKHRSHYNSILCYFFLNFTGEYMAMMQLPMYKWLESQCRRIFAVAQRTPVVFDAVEDNIKKELEEVEENKKAGIQEAKLRLGYAKRRERWGTVFNEFDAEALHEKQREMREFEAVFLADSGLFELGKDDNEGQIRMGESLASGDGEFNSIPMLASGVPM